MLYAYKATGSRPSARFYTSHSTVHTRRVCIILSRVMFISCDERRLNYYYMRHRHRLLYPYNILYILMDTARLCTSVRCCLLRRLWLITSCSLSRCSISSKRAVYTTEYTHYASMPVMCIKSSHRFYYSNYKIIIYNRLSLYYFLLFFFELLKSNEKMRMAGLKINITPIT